MPGCRGTRSSTAPSNTSLATENRTALSDLYDPLTLHPDPTKAHQALDRAVDRRCRRGAFTADTERLELLFERYREMVT